MHAVRPPAAAAVGVGVCNQIKEKASNSYNDDELVWVRQNIAPSCGRWDRNPAVIHFIIMHFICVKKQEKKLKTFVVELC